MRCTTIPSGSPPAPRTAASTSPAARSVPSAPSTPRSTAPMSERCGRPGQIALTATGPPSAGRQPAGLLRRARERGLGVRDPVGGQQRVGLAGAQPALAARQRLREHGRGRVGVDRRRAPARRPRAARASARSAATRPQRPRRLDRAAVERHGAAAPERRELGLALGHERAHQRRLAGRRVAEHARDVRGGRPQRGHEHARSARRRRRPPPRAPRRTPPPWRPAPRSTGVRRVQAGRRARVRAGERRARDRC